MDPQLLQHVSPGLVDKVFLLLHLCCRIHSRGGTNKQRHHAADLAQATQEQQDKQSHVVEVPFARWLAAPMLTMTASGCPTYTKMKTCDYCIMSL